MNERKINLAKYRFQRATEDLEIAKTLSDKGHFKSSLSSSYYAIFHSVRTIFAFEEIDSKKHVGVIHLFIQNFIKTGLLKEDLKLILSNAFQIRMESDYKDFYVVNKDTAEQQITNAEFFLKEVKAFINIYYKIEL